MLVLSLLVAALLVHTSTAFGQFGPPSILVTNLTITNVSGVTYSTVACTFQPCYHLVSTPVVRSGTNLLVDLNLFSPAGYCLCDFEPMNCPDRDEENETLVLGTLEPGDYTLAIYGYYFDPIFGSPYQWPIALVSFTVSNPALNAPMLSLSPTNSGLLKLDVAGVSGADYVIQSSTDFTNWTSIWTNHGAPFWATVTGGTNENCYFRTQIVSRP
jgi:hypothetical protein